MASQVTNIKRKSTVAKATAARPVPVAAIEPLPRGMHDFATRERRAFIDSVSPFRYPHERRAYVKHILLAAVFGMAMPHEKGTA